METKLNIKYDPIEFEKKIYDFWLEKNLFASGDLSKKPYTIVIPPPNITGKLHIGHAWNNTLQDIIIRRKRMQGYDALFLPGTDHAGVATQAKIDEMLKSINTNRYEIGRDKFFEYAMSWKQEYQNFIHEQWVTLGLSLDYNKEKFTLDENFSQAVEKVFIKLYDQGMIYRKNRITNWDPQAKTALSSIEVEHLETKGSLYYIKYHIYDEKLKKASNKYLIVATTRPETMFADQALMINPNDKRYQKFLNSKVLIPTTNTIIPIIADDYVDESFGSGVVKVTPAHDPNDYEVALRHNLEMPLCLNKDGSLNEMAGIYADLDRFECRKKLITDLNTLGQIEKIEEHIHMVGYSERTNCMVEPMLSLQWFVKMEELVKPVLNPQAKFYPQRFLKTYKKWLENVQDWCISRQIWWGHRIPAWYKGEEVVVSQTCPGPDYIQDEDVLDTWFSSALWPFATLGWPEETPDYKRYYPNDVLVTAYDIIFFWVSRMMFQGKYFTGEEPFKNVLLHGLIRDDKGRKMSKSLGNGVDPIEICNTYGADALRYVLATNSSPGNDLRFEDEKLKSSWNFINKLWNITRYITLIAADKDLKKSIDLDEFCTWILQRLDEVIIKADFYYEKFEFGEAAHIIYDFTWNEFANWFIEFSKLEMQEQDKEKYAYTLQYCLKSILKLLHPFIPFVTEKLYQEVSNDLSVMTAKWPVITKINKELNKNVPKFIELITKIRNLRQTYSVKNDVNLIVSCPLAFKKFLLIKERHANKFLFSKQILVLDNTSLISNQVFQNLQKNLKDYILINVDDITVYVLKGDIIDEKAVIERLLKEKIKLEAELRRSENILTNSKFLEKASAIMVENERQKLQMYKKQLNEVLISLKEYNV